jgi:hypothetical protein
MDPDLSPFLSPRRARRYEERFARLERTGAGLRVKDLPWGWLVAGFGAGVLVLGVSLGPEEEVPRGQGSSAVSEDAPGAGTLGGSQARHW